MTEFRVETVRIGAVRKHDNADNLSVTDIHGGYPVVFKSSEFSEGEIAVYVPVDAVMPKTPEWDYLGKHRRVDARQIRGVLSMGMLIKLPSDFPPWAQEPGQDVQFLTGVSKYDPSEDAQPIKAPIGNEPIYSCKDVPKYDIEGYRKYKNVLQEGEEVILTEKIHGENTRFIFHDRHLCIGSRTQWKGLNEPSGWSTFARDNNLVNVLAQYPNLCFYGELYGNTELKYDCDKGKRKLRLFDVFDVKLQRFLDYDEARKAAPSIFEWVPELYRGPWKEELLSMSEGRSTLGNHCIEGFVVKPVKERYHHKLGRVILKMVGQDYLLRNKKPVPADSQQHLDDSEYVDE